ncbi:hypothetical protein DRQ09_00780 [candidate division KSB1 bacterium]|nr:MAG: hypothetical protein DRQ09_00780 [candidate division KSB1 bacterium]
MKNKTKFKVHIVSHTHWDRAWYLTFQQFRYRLVTLIDKLIDLLENNPEYRSFHLDGQTIVLEDYFEIKPEKTGKLKKLINKDKIVIGPWYVLHDEFLVSGESNVRNLIIGHKVGEKYGKISKVGYIPDSFGHISQLPQILKGFDLDNVIFTRGMGDELETLGTEFIWEAPDGSSVLAINQLNGYCNGAHIGYNKYWDSNKDEIKPDFNIALKQIEKELNELIEFANTEHILINNGCDHLHPQPELPEIIIYLNKSLPEFDFFHTDYQSYISEIKKHLDKLKTFRGELNSGKRHPVLNGVYSTRMYLKQMNHRCQIQLEKYAEPISVISWKLNCSEYPSAFLEKAWKLLLKNHPHDNICGCSIDQVHSEMVPVFKQVSEITGEIVKDYLSLISKNINSENKKDCIPIIIFNSLPFIRNEIINRIVPLPAEMESDFYEIVDENDETIPFYINNTFRLKMCDDFYDYFSYSHLENFREEFLRFINNNDNFIVSKNFPGEYYIVLDIAMLAKNIPAMGYKTFFIRKSEKPRRTEGDVSVNGNNIENKFLKVSVKSNGSFDVYFKDIQKHLRNIHIFEDTEDSGDEYDYSPSLRSETITSEDIQGKITVIENNPLCGRIESRFILNLPEGLEKDRKTRKKSLKKCSITTLISLKYNSPVIEIETNVNNNVEDHRLRAHFQIPVTCNYSISDAQFCTMKRKIKFEKKENWKHKPQGIKPQQNFCLIENEDLGMAVINRGIPEFEASNVKDGTEIALTLFRGVGWLSRNDLKSRPYHVGPMIETPEAQCKGILKFDYGLLFYKNPWIDNKVHKQALIFNCPLISIITSPSKGKLPPHYSFMEISSDETILSAFKKAENRKSIICRFYNISENNTETIIKFFFNIKECWKVNLKEERIEPMPIEGNKIYLTLPGNKIETLEII